MKYCPKCKKNKFPKSFNSDRTRKDGLYGWCRICENKRARHVNPEERQKKVKLYKQKRRLWFDEYRVTQHCIQCGFTHPGALQFHHRKGETKLYNISEMVSRAHSIKSILKEITKCDVLCANCHFILHFNQRKTN